MTRATINHVSLVASSLEESSAFYQDMFGLEPIPTPNFGFPVQWLRIGDIQLHLFERPDGPPAYHHVGIEVDDFEAVYERAQEAGILDRTTFGHHIFELPNDCVQLYVRDPSGNLVEIDWPRAHTLSPAIRSQMQKMSDRFPQSVGNQQATLFLDTVTA